MEDVNDIVQEVYVEFYRQLKKQQQILDSSAYLIGIANNKLKKHYSFLNKISSISYFTKIGQQDILLDKIDSNENLEEIVFTKLEAEKVWTILKRKGTLTLKIFSLHYQFDLTIKEISQELHLTESKVKNILYRTQKEIKEKLSTGADKIEFEKVTK